MIVSFSGIDGAGKSTQIQAMETWLTTAGFQVSILSFWDDVVVFAGLREAASRVAFKGDQGMGSPAKPLYRRDKNVTSWLLTLARFCLYFADALSLFFKVRKIKKKAGHEVVIFDRYLYDELANLPLNRGSARTITRALLRMVPRPDAAYLIDSTPAAARARKPEYPLEFLHRNRQSYLALHGLVSTMVIIEADSIENMQQAIRLKFLSILAANGETASDELILR